MGMLQLRTKDVTNTKQVMRYFMDAVDDMTLNVHQLDNRLETSISRR